MKVLVYVDEQEGILNPDALGVLSKAAGRGGEPRAILCGCGVAELAAEVARHGARRVFVIDHPVLADALFPPRVDLLAQLCIRHDVELLLAATTVATCDMAAGLAARLEAGLSWGLVDVENRDGRPIGKRLVQNDSMLAEVEWTTPVKLGLFRPHACEPVALEGAERSADIVTVEIDLVPGQPRLVAKTPVSQQAGPPLSAAEIIVAGGRGIGKPENLGLVRELAAALGGVAAVSLPLVEMGWAPRSMQVGQTGTVVRPRLYLACGISGQMQHRVGMENAGTIVAINKDPGAPIMGFCDLAVVAEFEAVVPRLLELLRERRR